MICQWCAFRPFRRRRLRCDYNDNNITIITIVFNAGIIKIRIYVYCYTVYYIRVIYLHCTLAITNFIKRRHVVAANDAKLEEVYSGIDSLLDIIHAILSLRKKFDLKIDLDDN